MLLAAAKHQQECVDRPRDTWRARDWLPGGYDRLTVDARDDVAAGNAGAERGAALLEFRHSTPLRVGGAKALGVSGVKA